MTTTIAASNSRFTIGEAIAFTTADTLNVLNDGYLASQTSYGAVFRGTFSPTVQVYACNVSGSIYSAAGNAVALIDGHLNLSVKAGGVVSGGLVGAAFYGGGFVVNDGTIAGKNAGLMLADWATFDVRNHGQITGSSGVAISFEPQARGFHTIENSGMILGSIVDRSTSTDSTQSITNTGLIVGALYTGKGNDIVDTSGGEIRDSVAYLESGNDTYKGGKFEDVVNGGVGNDTMRGGDGGDLLIGADNNDYLYGGAGADQLYGNMGRDVIVTDNGVDDLARDRIDYNDVRESGATAATADIIYSFRTAAEGKAGRTDVMDLSGIAAKGGSANEAFTLLTTAGAAFTGATGQLRYVRTDNTGTANDYTMVYADVNGDKSADFALKFIGLETFQKADFIL